MLWLWISLVVALVGNLWVAVKVWRVSRLYGFITFLFFPAAIFFMFNYWGDEDHDIKAAFMVTLVTSLVFVYQANKLEQKYDQAEAEQVQWERR